MTTAEQAFVIVGAGLAGARAAETLRAQGSGGRIVLLGDETEQPYDRPPLSKDYLQGKSEKDKIYLHPDGWYAEHDIDLRLGTRVSVLDRAARQVSTENGERIRYDKLLLATGSSPCRLGVPGAEFGGVLYLRRLADCEAMKAAFASARRVAIVGAGWIGLETAAAARAAGCAVTVIETAELPLLAVLGREMAGIYAALHRRHGVELRLGATVAEITGENGTATGVRLGDGSVIEADTVVVGVGITPNTALAEAAGLAVGNGVLVDEHLATSDPDVFDRRRCRQYLLPATRHPPAPGALVGRPEPGTGRGSQHAGPGRALRPGALLLLRPVRHGDGVFRLRRAGRLRRGGFPR